MRNKYVIKKDSNIPLVGAHVFGIIDRGTNLLQVRATSGCPLNCIYCSVDEGNFSRKKNTYEVEEDYLVSEFNKIVDYKQADDIEAHIDGVGEPVLYPDLIKLIKDLRENKNVKTISMQSNGVLLDKKKINQLSNAGLDRINLSINTFNQKLAKTLSGVDWYDIEKVKKVAQDIIDSEIKLLIAPVVVPTYNDNVLELIDFAKKTDSLIGIQKYEKQKHGRKLKVKEQSWYNFKKWLKELEQKNKYNLLLKKEDFGIRRVKQLPLIFKKNEIVSSKVVLPGWLSNESIIALKNRVITVFDSDNKIGDLVKAKIVKTKHNLYLAKKL